MNREFKPPYEGFHHSKLYQLILKEGFSKKQAVKWVDMVYLCNDYKSMMQFNDVDDWINNIKTSLEGLPEKIAKLAYRIIAHCTRNMVFSDAIKAIHSLYPQSLNGETINYSCEDWISGVKLPFDLIHEECGEKRIVETDEYSIVTFILPCDELQKIISKQKQLAEEYISFYFDMLKEKVEKRLEGAEVPSYILKNSIKQIQNDLETDQPYYSVSTEKDIDFIGSLKKIYEEIILKNKYKPYQFLSHKDFNMQIKDASIVKEAYVMALWNLKKLLEERLVIIENQQESEALTEKEQRYIIDKVKEIKLDWRNDSPSEKVQAYKGHIKGALTNQPKTKNRSFFIELLSKEIAILDGTFDKKYLSENTPQRTVNSLEKNVAGENKFWNGITIEEVKSHFAIMTTRLSKNGKPFMTKEGLESFIARGFLKDDTQPKQKLNFGQNEKGFVIKRFYEFFVLCVEKEHPNRKKRFIDLVLNCFTNFERSDMKSSFRPNRSKESW